MNSFEQTWLKISIEKLREVLPFTEKELLRQYEADEHLYEVDEDEDLVFCRFAFPVLKGMDQIILLVYNRRQEIIADTNAYHMSAKDFLERTDIYDYLSEESDWMYLLHYLTGNTMFPNYPYPYCEKHIPVNEPGEVLLYGNAYVSLAYRRRGIFRAMLDRMTESVLSELNGIQIICSAMSMDPDVACYGPDAKEEPYHYSFEADEPVRLLNAEIAKKVGFTPIRLEPEDVSKETDGTKLWFCIKKEVFEIVEEAAA